MIIGCSNLFRYWKVLWYSSDWMNEVHFMLELAIIISATRLPTLLFFKPILDSLASLIKQSQGIKGDGIWNWTYVVLYDHDIVAVLDNYYQCLLKFYCNMVLYSYYTIS